MRDGSGVERRAFLKAAGVVGALSGTAPAGFWQGGPSGADDRRRWIDLVERLATPVLTNLAAGTLKARMPVEARPAALASRRPVTHLEAFGRLLAGIAPWIELGADGTAEGQTRGRYADLARVALRHATDPSSPDFLNFTEGRQPLVDAAFLAHALVRAPKTLVVGLPPATRAQVVKALESTRAILPGSNNWLLFSAMVEAGLLTLGAPWDRLRVDYAVRQHEQWYKGDGIYGDGRDFHWDYYNSFVIQPMLIDVLEASGREVNAWKNLVEPVRGRARRYAAILERLVAPDGSFPAIGRSLAYRCGAFQLLAQMALRRELPEEIEPAQVRGALTAVIRRTLEAPGTFDQAGWLTIGLCGHQPDVGETYISTGSLYLCATAFLPLGLASSDRFWAAPPVPWTAVRAWSGQAFPIDHAYAEGSTR
jgi:hypothetical protein